MRQAGILAASSLSIALLIGCSADKKEVSAWPERDASEMCNSDSFECTTWKTLAQQCDKNMARRAEGYTGRLEPYCTKAEEYREFVTGIDLSSDPGAYNF
ncbi:hypothetical protein OAL66_01780 [bacterium]|nr:hypothetical protein [bacterium]